MKLNQDPGLSSLLPNAPTAGLVPTLCRLHSLPFPASAASAKLLSGNISHACLTCAVTRLIWGQTRSWVTLGVKCVGSTASPPWAKHQQPHIAQPLRGGGGGQKSA